MHTYNKAVLVPVKTEQVNLGLPRGTILLMLVLVQSQLGYVRFRGTELSQSTVTDCTQEHSQCKINQQDKAVMHHNAQINVNLND